MLIIVVIALAGTAAALAAAVLAWRRAVALAKVLAERVAER